MQPLVSAMADLRRAFIAALKSLMRGKTFLMRVLLAFWSRPVPPGKHVVPQRTIDTLLKEAEHLLLDSVVDYNSLRTFSAALKRQFRDRMANDPTCMLPSYNSQLPLGSESGRYLSLDVGGSTMRVALVELHGCEGTGEEPTSRIVRMSSFHISPKVKALEGMAFFDWMAKRILETMQEDSPPKHDSENPILMALAWSFPLQQVSLKGALLQGMGKGFLAADGLLGRDLGELISSACKKQGLNVELRAIVNDSSAALLAQAYLSPAATRFGLILGTGFNLAVHLPVNMIGRAKYGERPQEWFESATHVLVNTEMGMFGKGILPMTRWDRTLNSAHPKPEFQPLEQFVSGMYLGEVCRIALVEAIKTAGVCGGVVPPSLETPYSLDTETLSRIEGDKTASLDEATKYFNATHPSTNPATSTDMAVIRRLASYVSQRSAALVAAVVYALWDLRREAESERLAQACDADEVKPKPGDFVKRAVVAFNGSVIEQYPGYLKNCQGYLDGLIATSDRQDVSFSDGETEVAIDLVMAKESSLLGAAVALACAEEGR